MKVETQYKRAIKKYAELMQMALVININTEHAVFADFSGHVNWLMLHISKSKDNYQEKLVDFGIVHLPKMPDRGLLSIDDSSFNKQCNHINKVHSKMKEWCDQNEVDVSGMNTRITSQAVSYI